MLGWLKTGFRVTGLLAGALLLLACALHISNSGRVALPAQPAGTIRIATHNVHYILLGREDGPWSVGDWDRRKGPLDEMFKAIGADLFAFQEMESFAGGNGGDLNLALEHLLAGNPGYEAAAVGDWREFPSTQPILYRRDRFRVLDQGWFFFSETPDVIYSRTFDGSYPAFASWARFEPLDGGRPFHVFNVHFEFKSRSNRTKSAELVRERIMRLTESGETVLLAGDINDRVGSATVGILEQAGVAFSSVDGATYHFNRGINLFGAIDHIAATEDIAMAGTPVVVRERYRGEWPSDHYPVFVDLQFTEHYQK